MAEPTAVHIGESSPEHVAYRLMELVAGAEAKTMAGADKNADRAWILDTYAECLKAVLGARGRGDSGPAVTSL